MTKKTCCVTGHRDIPADKIEYITAELQREILCAIDDGFTHFISGCAKGVDLIFAAIVVQLKSDFSITLEAAIPYRNRMKTTDKTFQNLIGCCDTVGVHSEQYFSSCFMKRNRFMVQASSRVIAVFDSREKGGTLATMRYAHALNREVKLIKL